MQLQMLHLQTQAQVAISIEINNSMILLPENPYEKALF
jgi:hypothetical protein